MLPCTPHARLPSRVLLLVAFHFLPCRLHSCFPRPLRSCLLFLCQLVRSFLAVSVPRFHAVSTFPLRCHACFLVPSSLPSASVSSLWSRHSALFCSFICPHVSLFARPSASLPSAPHPRRVVPPSRAQPQRHVLRPTRVHIVRARGGMTAVRRWRAIGRPCRRRTAAAAAAATPAPPPPPPP